MLWANAGLATIKVRQPTAIENRPTFSFWHTYDTSGAYPQKRYWPEEERGGR